MSPLASTKCAGRLLMALAATTSILFAVGCGSGGGIIQSLGGGFSTASLTGQYVIAQTGTGFDPQGNLVAFSETIVFTADGNGKLSITVDDFDQDGVLTPLSSSPETGTYSIASDGTGSLIFNNAPNDYAITMIDDSHFCVVEQDVFATASGFGEKQDTTAFAAPPSGTFVFKAHNIGVSSRVGGVTIANGSINGTEDLLILGFSPTNPPVTGTVSAPDSNGRGTFTLNDGTSFNYNYYVVGSGKFHFMSSSGALEIGQAEAQTGGPFSPATLAANTSYVFGSSGDTTLNTLAMHSAGVFTTDGVSSITGGAVDYVQDTTVNSDLAVSGGSYTLDSTGHGEIDLTVGVGTIKQKFWIVSGSRAYFLANNTTAVEDGTFSLQQGAPFSTLSSQAAFVMDGFDVSFKDRVGDFKPTSSGFNWNQAANAFDPVQFIFAPSAIGTSGTYQVSSNGRVTVTVNGVTSSLVFYLSSANTGFMVQEDANIGGSFTQQASQ